MESPEHIRALAQTLVSDHSTPGEQREAAIALFDAFAEIIEFDDSHPDEAQLRETWVDGGRAISLREAARCLKEFRRSNRFMKAVQAAIAAARKRFPGETIELLYAGTGPFAPLVLPLAHHWAADEVRYTLLDIHDSSLQATRKIAEYLGVSDRIRGWECGNAVTFQCAPGYRPHLLVTETMQQGLRDETQVAISRNLVPQIRDHGLLVPEQIRLFATLTAPQFFGETPSEAHHQQLGTVMTLNQGNAANGGECFSIDWPDSQPPGHPALLHTHIRVFGDIELTYSECSLNVPTELPLPPDNQTPRSSLQFKYRDHPKPGLVSAWKGGVLDRQPPGQRAQKPRFRARGIPYLRLPLDFEPEPLRAELAALATLADGDWVDHPNTGDYDGDWRSLSLRSLSGRDDDANTHSDRAIDYSDTPALHRSPALAALLDQLPGEKTGARLLSLQAGSRILEHQDEGCGLWNGLARLHVPIQTDEQVEFRVDGESLTLGAGECWYLNAEFPHAVENHSGQERVHLVVDCAVDDALLSWFEANGHPPKPKGFTDPSINCGNAAQIIEQLRSLGSEAADEAATLIATQANELCPEMNQSPLADR